MALGRPADAHAVVLGSPRARFAIRNDVRVTEEIATANSAHMKT